MQTEKALMLGMTDRYGITVGRPYVGDLDVCEEMVRIGAAWAYRQYLRDENLLAIEAEAKAEKTGLWGLSEAATVAPESCATKPTQVRSSGTNGNL